MAAKKHPSNPTENRKAIDKRIRERFEILRDFTLASTAGVCRALIGSGPAGLGKSYDVEKVLSDWDPSHTCYTISKGYTRATGLLKLLWKHRGEGQVIVFDDADTIFGDETSLNLLKAVCDTTENREVCYLAESRMVDDDGELIPDRFSFEASVIFLTNLDFDKMIEKDGKFAPHLSALVSRAHYIDLTLKSKQDFLVRIEQVVAEGLLSHLSKAFQQDVMDFIYEHQDSLRELSLRMALKIAAVRQMGKTNWADIARVTCTKGA